MNINAFSFQREPIKSRAPNVAAASFLFGPALHAACGALNLLEPAREIKVSSESQQGQQF